MNALRLKLRRCSANVLQLRRQNTTKKSRRNGTDKSGRSSAAKNALQILRLRPMSAVVRRRISGDKFHLTECIGVTQRNALV